MSILKTNKSIRQIGDFQTRIPKKEDFTEYIYNFVDGEKCIIYRAELEIQIDYTIYDELRKEANNNKTQIERHRAYGKTQKDENSIHFVTAHEYNLEDEIVGRSQREALHKAIKELSSNQRIVIIKKYFQNKSNVAIAREEGVSEGAIRDRLKRAERQLREYLIKA